MAKPQIRIWLGKEASDDVAEKSESMEDSDHVSEGADMELGDSDHDEHVEEANVVETSSTPRLAKSASKKVARRPQVSGLKHRPKRRAQTELMLMKCEECGISVTGRSNLKSHYRRIHLHVRNFNCTICGKGFWSNNARESHMLAVHTRKCDSCQEYVVESVPWVKGVDMKTRRDVICTCGAIVSIYSTFGRRRMYLRDDEPDDEGNVREPRSKTNTGTKYACGTCGKLFMKKSNCERHSRAHTDMKVCACDICGCSYTYESSLKKHMQTEHGIVKHVCELCGGNYSNLTALRVHMVKAHHNVAIGDNVAVVVQTKGEVDEDLEEFEEALSAREMAPQPHQGEGRGQVVIQTAGGQQVVVSEGMVLEAGGEHGASQAENAQVVISTDTGEPVSQEATAHIVEEALRSGQIVAQDGAMSIIIKQVQVDDMS